MYFSRVRIETSSLAQTKLLGVLQGDAYAIHQLIWKLFPGDAEGKRDFLFRQEFEKEQLSFSDLRRGLPIFYVVSGKEPSPVDGLLAVDTKPFEPKLKVGMHLGFEVRVNPVVREKSDRFNVMEWKKSRKVKGLPDKDPTKLRRYHDVLMDAKKMAKEQGLTEHSSIEAYIGEAVVKWLKDQGKRSGFKLLESRPVEVSGYRQQLLRKRGVNELRFSSVDIAGVLEVTDTAIFHQLLLSGMGHSRSFGCGMLMVRRV